MHNKSKRVISLFLFVLALGACTSKEADQEDETTVNEETVQFLLPQNISPTDFSVISSEESISANYTDQQWHSEGAVNISQDAVRFFIEDLRELSGRRVNREIEDKEDLMIQLSDRSDEISLSIWYDEEGTLAQVNNTTYLVETLPASLSPFSSTFLEAAIELDEGDIEEIRLIGDETIVLNQTTDLSEVEKIPFISGWYLHGPFETDFSVQYGWMDDFFESITRLHGEETKMVIEEVVQTIELIHTQGSETIEIGKAEKDGQTVIRVDSLDQNYLIPTHLTEFYDIDPLEIVDNFIALIPLDAVEQVEIKRGTEHFLVEIDRDFSIDDQGEVVIDSAFFINEKEVEEDVMRRAYQYLARLSYQRIRDDERDKVDLNEEAVTLTYQYTNQGDVVEKNIELIPVSDATTVIVKNDSISEFIADDEKLNDMFEALRELNK
ncbi:hypothetical protein [Alkalibacterium olivapovliticus]|uniref:DUF4340 domain-containing protein n=1 Tax=Alkalibacterium olivapovliticus TaxID=99907 RepID=A0A2T0W5K9_9LACT|nr:hypothetical protein [Alkalibacterium olivapovliticus]PRY81354.1 hypothetical protein CLV38_1182 [Alkalibacterium olivapovliticus]